MANTTGPIPYYLDILSQWPSAIPPESQWFIAISFEDLPFLKSSFIDNLRNFDTGGSFDTDWGIRQAVVNNLIKKEFQEGNDLLGCVFASQVTIPSESIQASNQGLSYAGYQAPVTMNQRDPYKKLSISFIETNSSFLDFIIRPWIISVGYYGFVTRANKFNLKARKLDVVYIAKSGSFNKPLKRKLIRFYNVAPISMGNLSNRYSSDGLQNISVDFAYDYYTVSAEDSNVKGISSELSTPSSGSSSSSSSSGSSSNNLLGISGLGTTTTTDSTDFSGEIATQTRTQTVTPRFGSLALQNKSLVGVTGTNSSGQRFATFGITQSPQRPFRLQSQTTSPLVVGV